MIAFILSLALLMPLPQTEAAQEPVSRGVVDRGHYVTMEVTAYCPCERCCGKTDGITKSGVKAVAGVTVAADLPLGTRVCIEGHWYTVQDIGGAIKGNRIDVYFDTHEEALEWGRKTMEVLVR